MIQFQNIAIHQGTSPSGPEATGILASPSCRAVMVTRLADVMREMAHAGENVSPETLYQRGWPRHVVDRLSDDAVTLARRRSIRQIGEAASATARRAPSPAPSGGRTEGRLAARTTEGHP